MAEIIISIIVPVYNVSNYIFDCLDSLTKISGKNIEVIVVNDGSTDGSGDIAQKFISDNSDKYTFVYIDQNNSGLSAARNAGLNLARGRYIAFIDSDDIFDVNVLMEMVSCAENSAADIVVSDYYEFFGQDSVKNIRYRYDKSNIPEGIITDRRIAINKLCKIDISFSVWNKIYRRSFLEKNKLFFLVGYYFEDLDFTFRAFYFANTISKYERVLYGYRQRNDSIMKDISIKVLDKLHVMDRHMDFIVQHRTFDTYKDDYYALYFRMLISVFYSIITNCGSVVNKTLIINTIFSRFENTPSVIQNVRFRDLDAKLIILLVAFKTRIINPVTLRIFVLIFQKAYIRAN